MGKSSQRCQRAVKAPEPLKQAGENRGATRRWRGAQGAQDKWCFPSYKSKEEKGDSWLSPSPAATGDPQRKQRSPRGGRAGAAGADKCCGLTDVGPPPAGLVKIRRFLPPKQGPELQQAPACSSQVGPWNRVSSSGAWRTFPVPRRARGLARTSAAANRPPPGLPNDLHPPRRRHAARSTGDKSGLPPAPASSAAVATRQRHAARTGLQQRGDHFRQCVSSRGGDSGLPTSNASVG